MNDNDNIDNKNQLINLQVATNSSNQVSVSEEGIRIGDEEYEDLEASRGRNEVLQEEQRDKRSTDYSQLLLEPGR